MPEEKVMHNLLKRQLRKQFGEAGAVPAELQPFLTAIDQAYRQSDDDRAMLERSILLNATELEQANSQMRAVFDAFPDLFFRLDPSGKILDHKKGRAGHRHISSGEFLGKDLANVMPGEAGERFRAAIVAMRERRELISLEYALDATGGLMVHYEARLLPLPGEEIMVIIRDISVRKHAERALHHAHFELERKVKERTHELVAANESLLREIAERQRAESALRKTETQFRTLVEQLPAITYMAEVTEPRRWSYVSPQIRAVFGFSPGEWIENPDLFHVRMHPEDRTTLLASQRQCLETGEALECEYRVTSKSGRVIWCRDQAVLLRDEENDAPFFQGVILDITEHKQLEEQLRQSLKMEAIGRLAGGIAHDFNNILTAIMGYSSLISTSASPEHPSFELANGIFTSAERAAGLTRQLLAYSRQQVLQPKVFELNSLIQELNGMLRRLIGENIQLRTVTTARFARIKADPGQIQQVLTNLVINARDALPKGGSITIETDLETVGPGTDDNICGAPPGNYVRVTVRDNGTGMSEETMAHLFEPFFTTKPQGKGTGLGLATCYGIVQQSGGFIGAESTLGQGTAFRILLPRLDEPVTPVQKPSSREPLEMARANETILLVEDETPVRTLTARLLERMGYRVHTAENGEDALRLDDALARSQIDLLLTDTIMPQMGGKELAEKMRTRRPELKVVLMSGYMRDVVGPQEALAVGMGFLQKPFTPPMLAKKMREELGAEPAADCAAQ